MDNVDPRASPSQMNYDELVDVFCFTGLSCVNSAFWFIYGKEYQVFYCWNVLLYFTFWPILQLYCLPCVASLVTPLLNGVFVCLQFVYLEKNLNLVHTIFVLGTTCLIIGVTGISFVAIYVYLLKKLCQGSYETNIVLNQILMAILHVLCIIFINGYKILCDWCLKQVSHVWRISGIVLIGALGFLTIVCCILRVVNRWQEYHMRRVRVGSIINTTDVA